MASIPIDSIWYCIKLPMLSYRMIGIVAVKCDITGKIKFYVGLARGENVKQDEQTIYEMGVPFYPMGIIKWLLKFYLQETKEELKNYDATTHI